MEWKREREIKKEYADIGTVRERGGALDHTLYSIPVMYNWADRQKEWVNRGIASSIKDIWYAF